MEREIEIHRYAQVLCKLHAIRALTSAIKHAGTVDDILLICVPARFIAKRCVQVFLDR